jgi:hypothetical protein
VVSHAIGLHHVTRDELARVIAELEYDGARVFVLPETIHDKRSFFDAAQSLPLNPPLVRHRDNWDALSDSIWGGIGDVASDRVGIVWPSASVMARSDPEGYAVAIDVLAGLPASLADPALTAGDPEKLVVVVAP